MCMYMYIYICIYKYIHICLHVYVRANICIYIKFTYRLVLFLLWSIAGPWHHLVGHDVWDECERLCCNVLHSPSLCCSVLLSLSLCCRFCDDTAKLSGGITTNDWFILSPRIGWNDELQFTSRLSRSHIWARDITRGSWRVGRVWKIVLQCETQYFIVLQSLFRWQRVHTFERGVCFQVMTCGTWRVELFRMWYDLFTCDSFVCDMWVGDVASSAWWRCQKLEYLCECNSYSRSQIWWQWISRLFLKLFLRTRSLPMGFTVNTK